MQYMENLRFTKTDVAQKARSRSTGVATGVTNHTADAYGFWSQGDTVAVVGNDKVGLSRDAGATFETTNQPTDLLGMERILSTSEASGGNNYSWAPVYTWVSGTPNTYSIYGYVVAFETVEHDSGDHTNTRDVVVQIFDNEGQLNEETVISNRGAPKVHPSYGQTIVSMVQSTGDIESYRVAYLDLVLGSLVSNEAEGVQDYCQTYNDTNEGYGAVGSEEDFNNMRLGYSADLRVCNYAFDSYHAMDSVYGAQVWKNGAGAIKVTRTIAGAFTGTIATVQTDTTSLFGKVLDVTTDDTYIWVLYSQTRTAAVSAQSDLKLTRYNVDMTGATTKTLTSNYDGDYVNGTVRVDSIGDCHIAVTRAALLVTSNQYETQGLHSVYWYRLDSDHSTVNDVGTIYSQRLCSDIAITKDDDACVTMQQWDNWNPGSGGEGTASQAPWSANVPGFTPTHKKPVTTALVRLDSAGDGENTLIATFDAGQSKSCLAGSDEQSMHMSGELLYFSGPATGADSHVFWYGNRVLLGATDDFFHMVDATDVLFDDTQGRSALHPGAARFSCYKLASDIRVETASFTNGMFLGTCLPTWYDGSTTLCSMQPIDSPEVVGWADVTTGITGDMGTYGAYQDLVKVSDPGHEAKVFNFVCGYYDDAGLVHRSAPSLDYYIGNVKADSTNGQALRVYVTPPIGLARTGRRYFLEAYEAWPGGTPQLAATKQLSTNSAGTLAYIDWATNLRPMVGLEYDVTDFRAAKTIYTAGNVLAADPWPNFDLVVRSGRRLFAHSISDPSTIYYSKTFESGVAPEFSAALTVSLGNEKITAMAAIDDKVILFSPNGCWNMYGVGPDNTGANGDFFIEQMVFPVGCIDQQSVVSMEQGIAFYSNTTKEFHILTRDLQLVDMGSAVKTISENITDVVSTIVVPNDHEVRWYCTRTVGSEYVADSATNSPPQPPRPFLENQAPAASIFTYNYKYQKWSIIEDAAVRTQRTVMIGDNVGELADDWDVYKESDSSWDRLCKWETPWIKVNQLQDFGRFYGLTFLGKYLSSWSGTPLEAGDLQVTIRYDYEGALGDTDVHRERANVDFDPADGDRLQFRVRPKRQKCQAIKIQIEEVATTGVEVWEPTYTTGQGFILTGVDVHYGAKGGSGDKSLGAARKKG
jgi:hypothetical protein